MLRYKPYLYLFFSFSVLFTYLSSTTAEKLKQDCCTDPRYFNHSLNRTFIFATDGPLAKNLKNNDTIQPYLLEAVNLFRQFTNLMDNRINNSHPLACNLSPEHKWLNTSIKTICSRQIGNVSDNCHSRIDGRTAVKAGELPQSVLTDARRIIVNARHALFNAISSIPQLDNIRSRKDLYWDNGVYEMKGWILDRNDQSCQLDRLSMLHKDNYMYYFPEITNNPVDDVLGDRKRQGIYEFVREDFKTSIKMKHPVYNTSVEGGIGGDIVEGTTILGRWAYRAALASVGVMSFDTNPAIQQAYLANEKLIDVASDSVTGSNIAVLALPMLMTLFPVVFIPEFPTFGILMYVIFTDICSTIPFLIKGIELILTTTKVKEEVVAYRSGNMSLGQTEIWVASCRGKDDFRLIGILFVVISILIMIVGLTTEWYVHRCLKNRSKSKMELNDIDDEENYYLYWKSNGILMRSMEDTYEDDQISEDESSQSTFNSRNVYIEAERSVEKERVSSKYNRFSWWEDQKS